MEQINHTAYLSNEGRYTVFSYGNTRLKFIAPYSLEYYIRIKEWDDGYLVVDTKYQHDDKPIEEYIDLIPILDDLLMDKEAFLRPIEKVEILMPDEYRKAYFLDSVSVVNKVC